MSKPIPWWWTEKGNDEENEMFYAKWKTVEDLFSTSDFRHVAFIAEQLVGEEWEETE